jgi:hypothetical protein
MDGTLIIYTILVRWLGAYAERVPVSLLQYSA